MVWIRRVFANSIVDALQLGGVAVLEDWYRPSEARQGYAIMDIYDGEDCKLVRAVVPRLKGREAHFGFEWMIAEPHQQVRSESHTEIRYLHEESEIISAFESAKVSLLQLDGLRVWRIEKL